MNCQIIMDLIPMYADKTASEETKLLVENHLKSCPTCKRFLSSCKKTEKKCFISFEKLDKLREKLRASNTDIPSVDAEFARLSSRLKKRKLRKTIIGCAVAASALIYVIFDIIGAVKRNDSRHNGGNL